MPGPEQLTAHIGCPNFALIDDIKRGTRNAIGDVIKSGHQRISKAVSTRTHRHSPKVAEHHGSTEDHGSGVSTVGTHDVTCNMAAAGFE